MSSPLEEEVLNKAKKIVSLEESVQNPSDKSYIHCIKFIFNKEFTQNSFTLPVRKKDKESFQYLTTFVKALAILFDKSEKERHKLYLSQVTSKDLGIDLYNLIKNSKF